MNSLSISSLGLVCLLLSPVGAQQKRISEPVRPPQITRTTSRHDVRRFGYGGTVTIVGAPNGSIKVEAWSRNEVDITAEIELRADSEWDLALLAAVNNFIVDDDAN